VSELTRSAAARKRRIAPRADTVDGSTTASAAPPKPVVRRPLDPDLLAALEEQRGFLRRSLDDLEREFDAGDLDDDDYRTLRRDYRARLAKVEAAVSEGRQRMASAAAARPRSLGRTALVVAGVALFAVGAGVLVARAAGGRDPGETITGNDPRTAARTQLADCLRLDRQAQTGEATPSDAFACYQPLFEANQEDPAVLANFGWFLYRVGSGSGQQELLEAGPAFVDKAIELNPDYADARAYRVVILNRQGRLDEAREELAALDALNPPPFIRELLEPIRQQLATETPTTTTVAQP
jgi:tetratricopeptide (TPR) repeat protein